MKKGLEGRLKSAMIDEFSYIKVQDVVTNSTVENVRQKFVIEGVLVKRPSDRLIIASSRDLLRIDKSRGHQDRSLRNVLLPIPDAV